MKHAFVLTTPDAPFEAKYVLKALEQLPSSSPAYGMLKITEHVEYEEYLRQHPNEFSWKCVAEVLYRCGQETLLNQLFAYLKSPEGKTPLEIFIDIYAHEFAFRI